MWMVIGMLGMLAVAVSLVGLVVETIRRRPKRPLVIGLASGFAAFVIGVGGDIATDDASGREASPPVVRSSETPPKPSSQVATAAQPPPSALPSPSPSASPSPSPPSPPPPPSQPSDAVATLEPRLLLPADPPGYRLSDVTQPATLLSGAPSVEATYSRADGKDIDATLAVAKTPVPLSEVDGSFKATRVGAHDGVVSESGQGVVIAWRDGAWYLLLSVEHPGARTRKQARADAERIAAQASERAATYLDGGPLPDDATRRAHVAALEQAAARGRVDSFLAELERQGTRAAAVRAETNPSNADFLDITVTNAWHVSAKQVRLQAAQNLLKLWASINSPREPGRSRIRLLDLNGNEVGGHRMGGLSSSIWVQD